MFKILFVTYYLSSIGVVGLFLNQIGINFTKQYIFLDFIVLYCYVHVINLIFQSGYVSKAVFINYFYFLICGVFIFIYGLIVNGFTEYNGDLRLFFYSIIFILPILDEKIKLDDLKIIFLIIFFDAILTILLRLFYYDSMIGKYQYYNPLIHIYGLCLFTIYYKSGHFKNLFYLYPTLLVITIILSASRAFLLSVIICSLPLLRFKWISIAIIFMLSILMLMIFNDYYFEYINFILYETFNLNGSIKIRLIGWESFISSSIGDFILGAGVGSSGENIHLILNESLKMNTIHNSILLLLYRFGIFVFLYIYLIYKIYIIYNIKNMHIFNYCFIAIITFIFFSPLGVDLYFIIYCILGSKIILSKDHEFKLN